MVSSNSKNTTVKNGHSRKGTIKYLGGLLFAKMMRGGALELSANAEEVNKLNVFPVPDGDTGDNMRMTIESGIAALDTVDSDDLAEVMRVMSRGMLLGARGNSGVILSQFFAGIAHGFESSTRADAHTLGNALTLGVEQAYMSVMTPTEGTILTVAREAVEYAVNRIGARSTIRTVFADLVGEMHRSLKRTPDLLKILKDAGVVDSGGAGLYYIMDGLNRVLNGEEIDFTPTRATALPHSDLVSAVTTEAAYGYCTELLVLIGNPDSFDMNALREHLSLLGDSIVTCRAENTVKIHVHTHAPESVLSYMHGFGEFSAVKIENMSFQHTVGVGIKKKRSATVAVSPGDGISNTFRSLGADIVIDGGQTKNPSIGDFIEAFEMADADIIYVFPNNSNIIMAATQAADIFKDSRVYVIPSKSVGECYCALTAVDGFEYYPDEVVRKATDVISRASTAYVCTAVRDATMGEILIKAGDTLGFVNRTLILSDANTKAVIMRILSDMLSFGERYALTVFRGCIGADYDDFIESTVHDSYPCVELFIIDGGQDVYSYIFAAE